jgi:hypothetical protein
MKALLVILLLTPLGLAACGDPGPVSRDEAAGCEQAVAAATAARRAALDEEQALWQEEYPGKALGDYIISGPDGTSQTAAPFEAPRRDYYSQVRAKCTARVLPIAQGSKDAWTIYDACAYDRYRETRLCADLPQ